MDKLLKQAIKEEKSVEKGDIIGYQGLIFHWNYSEINTGIDKKYKILGIDTENISEIQYIRFKTRDIAAYLK